ncbi:MAG: four helix bundle protein [Candidatus Wildermuthbacteria bacterium]|nr:four helix bundle protein [Candidatus Wildermuthbacteria bacterium]
MENDKEKFKKEFKARIYKFVIRLVKFVDTLPKDTSSQIFAKQILRSGTSIGANYIEAQASSSKKDFTNFFHHSLKSANETRFWIAVLRDTGKGEEKEACLLFAELTEIANILGSSILALKGKSKF